MSYCPVWSSSKYDLLDFLADPSNIQVTDDYGFFGGPHLNVKTYVVNNADEWIKLAGEMNASKTATQLKDEPICYYIELGADLDFTGKENVEMMGTSSRPFSYHLNGNGHTIKNLTISNPNDGEVGLIRYSSAGAIIENLNIDRSCTVIGSHRVGGVIGEHKGGPLTLRNIHTEATVYGTDTKNEQVAAGLLGFCSTVKDKDSNLLRIEDCYVGGKIGYVATNHGTSYNAALIAWWEVGDESKGITINEAPVVLKNIIVDCDLTGYESASNKRYIRHRHNTYEIVESGNIKKKSIFSFENCYGNIDQNDLCWNYTEKEIEVPNSYLSNLIDDGWSEDARTPPMSVVNEIEINGYSKRYSASTAAEYMQYVVEINALSDRNVYFELTDDIDFTGYPSLPMLGETEASSFSGFFNGNG
ncbi:MAG: hypothetical protein K2H85_09780, partial [Allobaculum sp.]|nr:hypothetical protein [Allobaculum sp.]